MCVCVRERAFILCVTNNNNKNNRDDSVRETEIYGERTRQSTGEDEQ